MLSQTGTPSSSFDADQFHLSIRNEVVEHPHRIRSASNTGYDDVRQALFLSENLLARLTSNAAMKIAHHCGIGMCAKNRSQQIVGGSDIRHPVPHGLVDRVFQSAGAGIYRTHLRAEQAHAKDVQLLAPHVLASH